MNADLPLRYESVRSQIQQACQAAGRSPSEVQLLAVSKKQSTDSIQAVYQLGQRSFGENYAQELVEKAEALKHLSIEWHFIGHLQSNKIKRIVQYASCIQTVADFRHAQFIAKAAKEARKTPFPIYVEVNVGNEETKSGVPLTEVKGLTDRIIKELPELKVEGLMAIPPAQFQDAADDSVQVPELYEELFKLSQQVGAGKLSLGMSGDLRLAIAAGSTLVRVGTAIFGARTP